MITIIRHRLSDYSLCRRIVAPALIATVVFVFVTLASHWLLPSGVLRDRNPLQSWDESPNAAKLAVQIFAYNQISVVIIVIGSLFANRRDGEEWYFSTGYLAFFTLVGMNAVTLGTWSFAVETDEPPVIDRLVGMLDIIHRSGLWEMAGQLLITCACAHIALVRSTGSNTCTRSFREMHMAPSEKGAIAVGVLLMLTGAIIESIAISTQ